MQKVLIFLFLFSFNFLIAKTQTRAIYIADEMQADIFLVNMNKRKKVQQAFLFKDNITTLTEQKQKNLQRWLTNILKPVYHSTTRKIDSTSVFVPSFATSLTQFDSLKVNKKYYHFSYSFSDDGFVGGSPNQINQQIFVKEIGVIYSYSNYRDAHHLLMLFHENETKQKALTQIYQYLQKKKTPTAQGVNWNKISQLTQAYTFQQFIPKLSNRWKNTQNVLKLIKTQSQVMSNQIHYSATIKNISDKSYFIPERIEIAPSKAIIHFEDTTRNNPWDLLDTHYGGHFKRIRKPIYLQPGDTVTFTQILPIRIGCGNCTHLTYSGFQIYQYRSTLFKWLLNDKKIINEKEYFTYPLREVK